MTRRNRKSAITHYHFLPVGYWTENPDIIWLFYAPPQVFTSILATNVIGYRLEGLVGVNSRTRGVPGARCEVLAIGGLGLGIEDWRTAAMD